VSAATAEIAGIDELAGLYGRYRALALAAGAALVLGGGTGELAGPVRDLLADCRTASRGGGALRAQLAACEQAAAELVALVTRAGGEPGAVSAADTERVRASHRRLRQEVWKVIPCEYVPCSIARGHAHADEA
jgi:hypothetical protein